MPEDKSFGFMFGLLKVKITYEVENAGYNDLSWIGEYGNNWQPGAIDRFEGDPHRSRDQYRYFYPAISPQETESLRKDLSKAGYSRHEAYTKARAVAFEQYKRMEKFSDGALDMLALTATVYYQDKRLESSSLCGIESDSDESYFESEEYNQAAEALMWIITGKVYSDEVKHHASVALDTFKKRMIDAEVENVRRYHHKNAVPESGYAAWYDKNVE